MADRGYDSNAMRKALDERNIHACIPPLKHRKIQYEYDRELYKKRHKVENMFGRIKDWRRIATRYDRCAHTFHSAVCIAAILCYWI